MIRLAVLALVLAAPSAAHAADAGAGQAIYAQRCRVCHQVGPAAKNSVGPPLNRIVGQPAAAAPGYSYSAALRDSGLVWDEATLKRFIASPRDVVAHTKMQFAGLKRDSDVDDVVAYLRTLP
jgi:cytochrome c